MCVCVCVSSTFPIWVQCCPVMRPEVMKDVKSRIAKASKAFGCLRIPIFNNPILSIPIKRAVYRATVVSVLMYGAETWTLRAENVRHLTAFHNRCVRTILGVTAGFSSGSRGLSPITS